MVAEKKIQGRKINKSHTKDEVKMASDFLTTTQKCGNAFQTPRNDLHPRTLYPAMLTIQM